jgi:AraC family transcriptional regulator, regulatory protein of adaptative response / DNA-3-methyladenine glycosylase II
MGFELAVRAIGQQVSVAAATTLSGRVAVAFGQPVTFDVPIEGLTHLFPTPTVIANANLSGLGITQARINAIVGLAQTLLDRPTLFQTYPTLDEAVRVLCELQGIGEWTAHYIAMRTLREPDAFPATDLVSEDHKIGLYCPIPAMATVAGLCGNASVASLLI